MQDDLSPFLREKLRTATARAHQALDLRFSELDLSAHVDYVRFLAAHFIAMRELFPVAAEFAERVLGCPVPDYPGLLRDDLRTARVAADLLPSAIGHMPTEQVGITYVVAGSRLGIAALCNRHDAVVGPRGGVAYLSDVGGLELWRRLLKWMNSAHPPQSEWIRMRDSALGAFAVFDRAAMLGFRSVG